MPHMKALTNRAERSREMMLFFVVSRSPWWLGFDYHVPIPHPPSPIPTNSSRVPVQYRRHGTTLPHLVCTPWLQPQRRSLPTLCYSRVCHSKQHSLAVIVPSNPCPLILPDQTKSVLKRPCELKVA